MSLDDARSKDRAVADRIQSCATALSLSYLTPEEVAWDTSIWQSDIFQMAFFISNRLYFSQISQNVLTRLAYAKII